MSNSSCRSHSREPRFDVHPSFRGVRSVCKRVNLSLAQGAEVVNNAGASKKFPGHPCTETAENQPPATSAWVCRHAKLKRLESSNSECPENLETALVNQFPWTELENSRPFEIAGIRSPNSRFFASRETFAVLDSGCERAKSQTPVHWQSCLGH